MQIQLAPMLSLEEAEEQLIRATGGPLPAEEVAFEDALDRVLAESVRCARDLPAWDNSAMDGFAVRAADVAGARPESPVRLRVVGEARAGGPSSPALPAGCAIRIATGARVPPLADAVVPLEQTLASDAQHYPTGDPARVGPAALTTFGLGEELPESCLVAISAEAGANIRRRGEDARAGVEVLAAHMRLGPAQISLAAAAGAVSLRVHRRPIAAVLSTGDEVRPVGGELGDTGITDSNRPALIAACRHAGAMAFDLGIAADTLDAVRDAIRPGIEQADVLVASGGVSVGPYDAVRAAFDSVGEVELWRVAIQPGKPFAFGRSRPRQSDGRRVLLFGLPGNPVSALVTFELFVAPILDRLGGQLRPAARLDRGVVEDRLDKSIGRRGFFRVVVVRGENGSPLRDERGRLRVRKAGLQGSHILSGMASADALAVVPEKVAVLEAGSEVEIRWLRG